MEYFNSMEDLIIEDLTIEEKLAFLDSQELSITNIETSYQETLEKIEDYADNDIIKEKLLLIKNSLIDYINSDTSEYIEVPIQEGILNPHKKELIEREIYIDSQYRKNVYSTSSNFTVELSETLTNVMDITLQSINIPCTWYNIDEYTGLSMIVDDKQITISSGRYDISTLLDEINTGLTNEGLTSSSFQYSTITQKVTFDTDTDTEMTLYFYKFGDSLFETCSPTNNLGYILGWKMIQPDASNNVSITTLNMTADSVCHLNNPYQCIFILDDMNHNHSNHTMIGSNIRQDGTSFPHYRQGCESLSNNIYYNTIPKSRTQSQIYSLNQISIGKRKLNLQRQQPIHSDVFAIFPLQYTQDKNMSLTGGAIQNNRRTYFGPVNIEKLKIILMDDRGKELNLNGTNWSFTIKVKQIYQ